MAATCIYTSILWCQVANTCSLWVTVGNVTYEQA